MTSGKSGDRGFSLVETLVAIGVLVTGVLSFGQLFVITQSAVLAAREASIAATHAASKLEELRSSLAMEEADGVDAVGPFTREWSVRLSPVHGHAAMVVWVRVRPGNVTLTTVHARLGQ